MKRLPNLAMLAAAAVAAANCATVFNHTSQRVEVTSTPPGAAVFVNGRPAGTTPTAVVVSRREASHRIRVGDSTRTMRRGLSPLAWLNAPAGFLTGAAGLALIGDFGDSSDTYAGLAMGFLPILVDLAAGGAYRFQRQVDFSARRGPRAQQTMCPVQPRRHVPPRDVQLTADLLSRPLLKSRSFTDLPICRGQPVNRLQ